MTDHINDAAQAVGMRKTLQWIADQRWNEDADLDDICTRAGRELSAQPPAAPVEIDQLIAKLDACLVPINIIDEVRSAIGAPRCSAESGSTPITVTIFASGDGENTPAEVVHHALTYAHKAGFIEGWGDPIVGWGGAGEPQTLSAPKEMWAMLYLHDWDPPKEGQEHRWEPGKNVFPEIHNVYATLREANAVLARMSDPKKYWVRRVWMPAHDGAAVTRPKSGGPANG